MYELRCLRPWSSAVTATAHTVVVLKQNMTLNIVHYCIASIFGEVDLHTAQDPGVFICYHGAMWRTVNGRFMYTSLGGLNTFTGIEYFWSILATNSGGLNIS